MHKNNILNFLEKRQLGYGSTRKVYDVFVDQLSYPEEVDDVLRTAYMQEAGLYTAWKFSRNRSNLHLIGGSSLRGRMVFQNTLLGYDCPYSISAFKSSKRVQDSPINNFAWAEPQMKLITASDDLTSKLCSLDQSGQLVVENEFNFNSKVQSVMFCPGSSDVACGSCQDGSVRIFDARVHKRNNMYDFVATINNAHGVNRPVLTNFRTRNVLSTVIFQSEHSIISCYSMDRSIKIWDLRKIDSYEDSESLPVIKYNSNNSLFNLGYMDIVTNSQDTLLYGSGTNNIIYCFSLGSSNKEPICQYSGHHTRSTYPKISINHDGRYLFSGCMNNGGVLWSTDFPYIEKPILKTSFTNIKYRRELCMSDWCADPSNIKLATGAQSMPIVWSLSMGSNRKSPKLKFLSTKAFRTKPYENKNHTVPITFKPELKNKYKKQTEEDMEKWDKQNVDNLPSTSNS